MAFSQTMEEKTLRTMIGIYCHALHHTNKSILCSDCREVEQYALLRIEKCPFGEDKPACSMCTVHCYKPIMREKIRTIMRYAGPRMLTHSPILAIRYIYRKKFKSRIVDKKD